jgi:hypothetical protein
MMPWLLAAAGGLGRSPFEPPPLEYQPQRVLGMATKDILLIVGASAVLALVLFLWVYLTRKERRHRSQYGGRVIYRNRGDGHRSGQRRRRRRHRTEEEELRRNPTLQETGGLPPPRPDDVPPAPPQFT